MIYSYAELKDKIKVGDTVRAVAGKPNSCCKLNDGGSNTAEITKITDDLFYINDCWHYYYESSFLEILVEPTEEPTERIVTWENLQKGDVILDDDGCTCAVLARIEDLVAISSATNKTTHFGWYSIEQLKDAGYKPEPLKQKRKVTLAEIAEKFGEEVEVVE